MNQYPARQHGMTLIELMIVVVILGILASIAIPIYQDSTQRAKVSGAVSAISHLKIFISECYGKRGDFVGCSNTLFGIPEPITAAGQVNHVVSAVVTDGQITLVSEGIHRDESNMSIIFAPSIVGGNIQWSMSGNGCLDTDGDQIEDNLRGVHCGIELLN